MKKTIGIFAHVDAGKTTFTEQLLYHTDSIQTRGRVDHKDSFLDNHDIEKERGITVFADQAIMNYQGSTYYIVDTPGHVDFSPEMERAIQTLDYAIIIVSAVEGIQGHTETVWKLLREYSVPTFFFINKIDREGADADRVFQEIRSELTVDVCKLTPNIGIKDMNDDLIEFLAERDEALFDHYLESGYDQALWLKELKNFIKENKVFPCAAGSALKDEGIVQFLENLSVLTETEYAERENESFAGRVYKIRHDGVTRLTFIKAIQGSLKVRDMLRYGNGRDDVDEKSEKITEIRKYNGPKYKVVDEVTAGDLFAVTGLSEAVDGDGVGELMERSTYFMVPTMMAKVIFQNQSINEKEALRHFQILDVEDSSLQVTWRESSQSIYLQVMGTIQLEVLVQVVKERFGYDIAFGDPEILYRETIELPTNGYGHFEPLGHYAEVHLQLEPGERNSGIIFYNHCHANDLSIGNQNLIRHHLFERDHHGLLTGAPLTDLKITLLTGRAHNKHTSGGDFREATYRALRQGLEKTKSVLLEPYYDFKLKVDMDHIGRVLSDLQLAHGYFSPPENVGGKVIVTGRVPVSTFMHYSSEFAAITQGKGSLQLVYGGYDRCHNQEEVIERIGYNKNADPEYTSSSIFCAKGKGYTVPWDKAEDEMHCL
ncbi:MULTISPECIES: GTP-binding protein [Bacillaceae]|uniref:TetM/TetW/TetO/TetS family tetracycline resistance ribosomal protection protein n=1 Tax=Evansella alkalicola TaxID=745819 RepID=A0ABS6JWZ9_9BACI|nr:MULTISPECIES: TetM/TetW/TetO/TetS family tetracycline resistance ribosomal protection protein [Bacillaceae]MBU9722611.1 TetM/TetW/TetO/TetS family tetracycline resistance ribosomal protection protein [Bacillus alkalicola]